jgi:lysophospholipase L1-like esterase
MKQRILLLGGMLLSILFMLFFDSSFAFVKPDIKLIIIVFSFYVMLCAAFCFYGVKKTIFILIPYVVVFLLLEVGCRIWISNYASRSSRADFLTPFTTPINIADQSIYLPHHYTLYNLRPNLELPEGTKHNNLGMRDHRVLDGKKEGVIRVVFIGGSTTYTIGIKDNKKIFTYRLEERLHEYYKDLLPDHKVQVINAGMGGATSAENMLRLIFFVSEIRPDLVVIQHGLNDVLPRIRKDITTDFSNYRKRWDRPDYFLGEPIAYGLSRRSIESSVILTFLSRKLGITGYSSISLGSMIDRRDVQISTSYLATNDTRYFERNTRYMIAICKSLGAKVLLSTEAYTEKAGEERILAMPEHNRLLSKIAKEEGVLFYDFYHDMIKDDMHMPDGRHVSQKGSDLKADLFYSFFIKQKVIQSLAGK